MLSNLRGNSFADPDLGLDLVDEEYAPEEVAGDEDAGLFDLVGEGQGEGLGLLAAVRRRRARRPRRARARRIRRLLRLRRAPRRPRRIARARRRRARRPRRVQIQITVPRRRRARKGRGRARAARPRRRRAVVRTIIKTVPVARKVRRRRRRARTLGSFGQAISTLANTVALQSVNGLGAVRRRSKVRRPRRRRAAAPRVRARRLRVRRPRRSRRARGRTLRGFGGYSLGSLADMGAAIGEAEVQATIPVLGVLEYLGTTAGLEGLGGVTLSSFVYGLVEEGLMKRLFKLGADVTKPGYMLGTGLISAIVMWELGRLLGSAGVAKFGAFYALGKVIDSALVKPQVVDKLFAGMGYLGQQRVPEGAEFRGWSGFGQARIPEGAEIRGLGQQRVPEAAEFKDVDAGLGQRIVTEEELLGAEADESGIMGEGDEESSLF